MTTYLITGETFGPRRYVTPWSIVANLQLGVGQTVELTLSPQDQATLINSGVLATSSAIKRITHPIGGGDGDNPASTTLTDFQQRIPILLPVTPTRWRLRIGNYNGNNGAGLQIGTAVSQLVGVAVGPLLYTNANTDNYGRWAGANAIFSTAPTIAPGQSGTVPAGASPAFPELVTPWVIDNGTYFQAGILAGISMGFTSDGTGQVVGIARVGANPDNMQWRTTGASTSYAQTTPPGVSPVVFLAFDIRLEYECVTDKRSFVAIGDSITAGFTTATTVQPHETWPGVAGIRNRAPWINMGAGGASTTQWLTTTDWRWKRCDLTTSIPDIAIAFLGANDLQASQTGGNMAGNMYQLLNILKGLAIPEVWFATAIPGPLTAGQEAQRLDFNQRISNQAAGVTGYIDFDKAIAAGPAGTTGAALGDTELLPSSATNPHPNHRGYQRMGELIHL